MEQKVSDIIFGAMKEKNVTKMELSKRIGMLPSGVSNRMRTNRWQAQEFLDAMEQLGYDVVFVDKELSSGQSK